MKKIQYFKITSIFLCVGFTGLSLYNQFGLYHVRIGLVFAVGASAVIESFRLYVLYIVFARELPKVKTAIATVGYISLAAWCLYANYLAIEDKVDRNENHVISELSAEYQKIKTAAVEKIKADIEKIKADIDYQENQNIQNAGLINSGFRTAFIAGVKSARQEKIDALKREISGKLAEIEAIVKSNPKNAPDMLSTIAEMVPKYAIKFESNRLHGIAGDRALKLKSGNFARVEKLIINLALIILIEIGIIVTAMSAKSKLILASGRTTVSDSSIVKSDSSVLKTDKVKLEYQKIVASQYYSEWKAGKRNSAKAGPGRRREFIKMANKFFRKHPEMLEVK